MKKLYATALALTLVCTLAAAQPIPGSEQERPEKAEDRIDRLLRERANTPSGLDELIARDLVSLPAAAALALPPPTLWERSEQYVWGVATLAVFLLFCYAIYRWAKRARKRYKEIPSPSSPVQQGLYRLNAAAFVLATVATAVTTIAFLFAGSPMFLAAALFIFALPSLHRFIRWLIDGFFLAKPAAPTQ